MEKNSKKKFLIGALAVLLVAICVGGTVAWLTAKNQLTNSFTVGNIVPPTTDDEEKPLPADEDKVDGNLYEPGWVDGSKIIPGTPITKDPMVGIGVGSEPAYVFLFVKSATTAEGQTEAAKAPYFTLNTGWDEMSGHVATSQSEDGNGKYTSGLFVYGTEEAPKLLTVEDEKDTWTTSSAFSNVTFPEDAQISDYDAENANIEVYSYVIAASDPADAKTAAIEWAAGLA